VADPASTMASAGLNCIRDDERPAVAGHGVLT
jgi:hypothetical protein